MYISTWIDGKTDECMDGLPDGHGNNDDEEYGACGSRNKMMRSRRRMLTIGMLKQLGMLGTISNCSRSAAACSILM